MTVRTRFAPSPTGYLHIGGVRTALFNWLFARKHGASLFCASTTPTPSAIAPRRCNPSSTAFAWLGIHWDEGPLVGGPYGPYFQSQRASYYRDAAMKLLESGHAYPCYMTKEELETLTKQAESEKATYIHRGKDRPLIGRGRRARFQEKPTTIRLKVPEDRTVVIDDQICGKVEVQTNLIGDPVIARSDGTRLYNFATVVDDIAMKITHVIRAKEHLSNTPGQVLVYEALAWPPPVFAPRAGRQRAELEQEAEQTRRATIS